jgi:transcriptional regulator with XRE-family HTH domain
VDGVSNASAKPDEETIREKVGDAIRKRRNSLNMSQEALADAAQITRTHMGEVERGRRNLSLVRLVRIARALQWSAADLLNEALV